MKNFEVRIYSSQNLNEKWYVYIYHNSKIIKKIYTGINKFTTFEDRMVKAESLKKFIEKEITDGWNPHTKKNTTGLTLFEALDFGLEKKKATLAKGSYGEYSIAVNMFKDYATKEGLKNIPVSHCERSHIKTVLGAIRIGRGWSTMNYNKTLRRLSSIFSELIEWDIVDHNPARDIKPLKEENNGGYEIMSNKEHKAVFTYLKQFHFNYYVFCSIVYYTGIRMGELIRLKCGDFDMDEGIIRINAVNSKSKKIRKVPMIGLVKELLSGFDLSNEDYIMFGSPVEGKIHKLVDNYFSPNPYQAKRTYPTHIWKKHVIKGLEVDKKLYSMKHKGGSDKLKAGIDIDTISNIFGHSRVKMTELYADHIKNIRFEKAKNVDLDEY